MNEFLTRICPICGNEFKPKASRRKVCYSDHVVKCQVCGKEYVESNTAKLLNSGPFLCSTECVNRSKSMHKPRKVKCAICGKEFITRNEGKYCGDPHSKQCIICGSTFYVNDPIQWGQVKTCSPKCKGILVQQTFNKNYGKDVNPEGYAMIKAKQEATNIERYGAPCVFSRESSLRESITKTIQEKFEGGHPMRDPEVRAKWVNHNLEKFGTEYALQNPDVIEKGKQTCMERYGVDNYAKSIAFHTQVITDPSKAAEAAAFSQDPRQFIVDTFGDTKPTLHQLALSCGMRESSVGWIAATKDCQDMIGLCYSSMEDDMYELIHSTDPNTEIVRNTFKVITPYELDIYLPEYNLAIECNPTWTHNSSRCIYDSNESSDAPKSKDYHKMKTDLCESKGIFLFHVFGYEWTNRRDVIESMLRNLMNKNPVRIGARKLEIAEISDAQAREFLEMNHRQGSCIASVRIALIDPHTSTIYSLMTFSKARKTIGQSDSLDPNCYELSRFCNAKGTTVSGAASKLFKYFVKSYNPREIISFSDRAHTRGNLYQKLGFYNHHQSDPGYVWVNISNDTYVSRNAAQKKNIQSLFKHEKIDLSKTEVEIMEDHNFVQVFDSGVIHWRWKYEQV